MFHVDKAVPLCLLSYYLEYTRHHRDVIIKYLESNSKSKRLAEQHLFETGLGRWSAGWSIMGDRGFKKEFFQESGYGVPAGPL